MNYLLNITITDLFLINAFAVIIIGLFGILTKNNIIKILISINILQTGVNLLLVALGYVEGGNAPIVTQKLSSAFSFVDPLPQALVLTSIVIGFGTTALGLAVAIRYYKSHKTLNLDKSNKQESEIKE